MQHLGKIIFIKAGNFSHSNEIVHRILLNSFPDYDIEVFDVLSDIFDKRDLLAMYSLLKEYGWELLTGRRSVGESFHRTIYVFKKIRRIILKRFENQNIAFTFQTQSLFDASLPGVPHFVYTDHTHLANLTYPGFDKKRILKHDWIECERSIYHNATVNFTMSSNISKSIIENYFCGPDKVKCVYCGSNVDVMQDEKCNDERYGAKIILFVGVDWDRKGGPTLVKAFNMVLEEHPDASLVIVGCKPRLNIPNCTIAGKVPITEVKKYFMNSSIFCLPTIIEPFGIVFLEAMAHKLPVIGTNIGAIPDFIHEAKNGFKIEPHDSKKLSQYIIELLKSPEKCKEFGDYGYKLFWDQYSWDKTGIRIREYIEQSLN